MSKGKSQGHQAD